MTMRLLRLLLPLSHFSHVQLCVTPEVAAHQAPPSLGFSRQEHWSGLPFPSPMRESGVAQWCPTPSDPMDCKPTRLLHPWDFPGKRTGGGCHCLLRTIRLGDLFIYMCQCAVPLFEALHLICQSIKYQITIKKNNHPSKCA